MRIVVPVKQVLDPDGINSYARDGKLGVAPSGRAFVTSGTIPLISSTPTTSRRWRPRSASRGHR